MIEALVAITVLTLGVITPLSMLAKSIADANYARNQITAFFLAQEGQEMIINKRDNNRLNGHTDGDPDDRVGTYWLGGANFGDCVDREPGGQNNTDVCYIDPQDLEIHECDGDNCPALRVDDNGFYGYADDANPSIFTRWIQIEPLETLENDDNQERGAIVRVKVSWPDKGRQTVKIFELNSIIYRWLTYHLKIRASPSYTPSY